MLTKLKALFENKYFDNPIELALCRTVGRKTGATIYRKNRWRILIDHHAGDHCGTKACLVSPMYREFFSKLKFGPNPRILDVGGNGGGFVLLCADIFGELGVAVSLKFNPSTFRRLWYDLKSNLNHDIVVLNAAASDADGELVVPDLAGSTSAKIGEQVQEGKGVTITKVTFDSLAEQYFDGQKIDLCKINIEGSEFDFLVNGRGELLTKAGLEVTAKADPMHGDVRLYQRLA